MALVLLSGGLDSTTVLWQAARKSKAVALFVDYGQRAAEAERRVSSEMAAQVWTEFVHVRLPDVARLASSALTGNGSMQVAANTVVPGRNALLLSIGAMVAQSCGIEQVLIGCNATDEANYPDCRVNFIEQISSAFAHAYGVSCEAPLLRLSKSEVVRLARSLGVPIERTSSCYRGTACGECVACVVRKLAIEESA